EAVGGVEPEEARELEDRRPARPEVCLQAVEEERDGREAVMAEQREQLLGEAEEGDEVHEAEEAKEDEAGEPVRRARHRWARVLSAGACAGQPAVRRLRRRAPRAMRFARGGGGQCGGGSARRCSGWGGRAVAGGQRRSSGTSRR